MYTIVHKQLGKYNGIKELLIEFNSSLQNLNLQQTNDDDDDELNKSNSFTNLNLNNENQNVNDDNANRRRRRASYSNSSSTNQLNEYRDNYFNFTRAILEKETLGRTHQYALLNSIIFTCDRRQDIMWLLKLILQTLDNASTSGCVFSYLPHYYLVTCLNLCTALRFYFNNNSNSELSIEMNDLSNSSQKLSSLNKNQEEDLECKRLLKTFCLFITGHFCDERIVNNDHKELIAQNLISLIASKQGLSIMENNICIENRLNLIKKLTQPFENRAWTHSNWILVRMWKGDGFAFKKDTFIKLADNLSDDNLNF